MLRFKAFLLFVAGVLLLSACADSVTVAEEYVIPAKPQVWQVGFSPGTVWLETRLEKCTSTPAGSAFIPVPIADGSEISDAVDFYFRWGDPVDGSGFIADWRDEEMAVFAHPDVPIRTLTQDEFVRVFTQNLTDWGEINPSSSFSCALTVWGYPQGSDIRANLESVVGNSDGRMMSIVNDPTAMLAAVRATSCSIGVVPVAMLDDSVNRIAVDDLDLNFPILVVSDVELSEDVQDWLGCLQAE